MKTIFFEDHGQDFLEWDIKERGDGSAVVVASRPFQGFVWVGKQIRNYRVGARPLLRCGRWARPLLYRIIKIVEAPREAA